MDYKWVLRTLKLIYESEKIKTDDKVMKYILKLINDNNQINL